MKTILGFLGPIIVLAGVIILAIYFFTQSSSNTYLIAAGVTMLIGLVVHVILNKIQR